MDNTVIRSNESKGLSACVIKYIAVAAMLIDHIAWCFAETYSVLGQIMHIIGRLTAPIMCYFIAEGYHYTRNVGKYLLRLGFFAVISWAPFVFMEYGTLPVQIADGSFRINPLQGVIYTFFLTLLALRVRHSERMNAFAKVTVIVLLCILSMIGDWFFFPIIWALLFDKYRDDFKKQMIWFAAAAAFMELLFIVFGMSFAESAFQLGVLLAVIPLHFYNGSRGGSEKLRTFNKWFFYIFYPAHMVILGILRFYVFI